MIELDKLDELSATAFDGYLVRKDLVRKYSQQYPVPTYVVEFLLGRYCATIDEDEIEEGLSGELRIGKGREREVGDVVASIVQIDARALDELDVIHSPADIHVGRALQLAADDDQCRGVCSGSCQEDRNDEGPRTPSTHPLQHPYHAHSSFRIRSITQEGDIQSQLGSMRAAGLPQVGRF